MQHYREKMLRRIVSEWVTRTDENKIYRRKSRHALQTMLANRMTKIIKGWFNLVDLLKQEHALSNDILKSRASRLKRHYFVAWLTEYLTTAKRRVRFEKLAKFNKANFARRYFAPWLKLARFRTEKRSLFFQMRAKHLVIKAFGALRENVLNSNGDRRRAR